MSKNPVVVHKSLPEVSKSGLLSQLPMSPDVLVEAVRDTVTAITSTVQVVRREKEITARLKLQCDTAVRLAKIQLTNAKESAKVIKQHFKNKTLERRVLEKILDGMWRDQRYIEKLLDALDPKKHSEQIKHLLECKMILTSHISQTYSSYLNMKR